MKCCLPGKLIRVQFSAILKGASEILYIYVKNLNIKDVQCEVLLFCTLPSKSYMNDELIKLIHE